jgi:hypothetical protein
MEPSELLAHLVRVFGLPMRARWARVKGCRRQSEGTGRSVSGMDFGGHLSFSFRSSSSKQL